LEQERHNFSESLWLDIHESSFDFLPLLKLSGLIITDFINLKKEKIINDKEENIRKDDQMKIKRLG
jgi:hypothetical protein